MHAIGHTIKPCNADRPGCRTRNGVEGWTTSMNTSIDGKTANLTVEEQGEQERRKQSLMSVMSKGLPTLPAYILDLNALLSSSSVDLKKVGKLIRTDPSLSAQILRLCNSAMFGMKRRVLSIEQASILMGTERLRTLILTCSAMQFAGKSLPADSQLNFWQHSFLAALLSERIANAVDYFEKEQAYLAGLLHDVGQLPLWMIVSQEGAKHRPPPPSNWIDNVEVERTYFGMDHCTVGRWLALSWNLMPSFIDVLEHHHTPALAGHDSYLAGIVAAADKFLRSQTEAASSVSDEVVDSEAHVVPDHGTFLTECMPQLSEVERQAILEMLQTEYIHMLPLVQLGFAGSAPDGDSAGSHKV
jgi:HD-like signal output (HDOD) protein